MDPKIINYIKDRPKEAEALAGQWQEFIATNARENPEILAIKSREEFLAWATQHQEKHIDTNIWLGKEITDVYLRIRQEDSGHQAQRGDNKKEERQREGAREIPRESISQPTAPSTTQQPQIQTPTTTPQAVGRRFGPPRGRVVSGIGRFGTRLVTRVGMTVGRAAVAGLVSNPIGWLVIGVIIAIALIVFLIIMFAGGGGGIGGGFQATVECVDPNNPDKSVLVTDGNTCAQNAATFYSNLEGIAITTTCLDRCTDFLTNSCERNINNLCSSPDSVCGAPFEAFCIEYSPADAAKNRLYDCITGGQGYAGFPMYVNCNAPTPTPIGAPTPTPVWVLIANCNGEQSGDGIDSCLLGPAYCEGLCVLNGYTESLVNGCSTLPAPINTSSCFNNPTLDSFSTGIGIPVPDAAGSGSWGTFLQCICR